MKKLLLLAMVSLLILVAGCNSGEKAIKDIDGSEEELNLSEDKEVDAEETKSVPEFPPAPTEASDIISLGAGKKMKEIQLAANGKLMKEDFAAMKDFTVENLSVEEIYNDGKHNGNKKKRRADH